MPFIFFFWAWQCRVFYPHPCSRTESHHLMLHIHYKVHFTYNGCLCRGTLGFHNSLTGILSVRSKGYRRGGYFKSKLFFQVITNFSAETKRKKGSCILYYNSNFKRSMVQKLLFCDKMLLDCYIKRGH